MPDLTLSTHTLNPHPLPHTLFRQSKQHMLQSMGNLGLDPFYYCRKSSTMRSWGKLLQIRTTMFLNLRCKSREEYLEATSLVAICAS
jgi:hypothetical protein